MLHIQSREADLGLSRIRMNRQGKGFLIPDDSSLKEIMVPENATGTALHEDRVLVRRDHHVQKAFRGDGSAQETGAVIRILERKRTQVVGTLQRSPRFFVCHSRRPAHTRDIYVTPPRDVGSPANVGDKVVVELHEWETRNSNPEGEIIEVLSSPDEEGVDMLSVLRQYSAAAHFPEKCFG